MLKEKLYSEYQVKYNSYHDKQKKLIELEHREKQLALGKEKEREGIKQEKKQVFDQLVSKKEQCETQLASIVSDGSQNEYINQHCGELLKQINDLKCEIKLLEKKMYMERRSLMRKCFANNWMMKRIEKSEPSLCSMILTLNRQSQCLGILTGNMRLVWRRKDIS